MISTVLLTDSGRRKVKAFHCLHRISERADVRGFAVYLAENRRGSEVSHVGFGRETAGSGTG